MFFLIIPAIIAFYVWSLYNRLVTIKTRIKASIQELGNQLKRQADLIPNLVESVKGYLTHEKGIFDRLAEAREAMLAASSQADPQKMADAQDKFTSAFGSFKAVMESTPEIKGVTAVTQLMEELRDTADKVMYSRRTIIDLTADYNVAIVTFPNNLIASLFSFEPEKGLQTEATGAHLEVSADETISPKVKID